MHAQQTVINMPHNRTSWKQWLFPLRERLVCSEREALLLVGLSALLLVGQVVRFVRAAVPPAEVAEMAYIDSLFDHITDSIRAVVPLDPDTVHIGFGTLHEVPEVPEPDTHMWVFVDTLEKPKVRFPLDLNAADLKTLQALPRIGPAMAARIVAWRNANGPFNRADDLLRIKGIGPRTLEQLLPLVTFGPDQSADVRVDSSSAAEGVPDS